MQIYAPCGNPVSAFSVHYSFLRNPALDEPAHVLTQEPAWGTITFSIVADEQVSDFAE
jgi:hypothetical protein